ncbi:MAG: FHA domain-containing protein [Actinomycetia bacterium]|nr:FHA domain-containing protein [Actinomycetes bacterium]
MPICPNGHQSGTDDWCEVCGMRMTPPPASSASSHGSHPPSSYSSSSASPASAPPSSPSPPGFASEPTAAAELCPRCGTPREGAALFCEECRYNFGSRSGPAPAGPLPVPAPGPGPGVPEQGYPEPGVPGPGVPPAGVPPTGVPPTAPGFPPYQRYESQRSRPSQINRPAEPLPSESVTLAGSGDFLLDPPSSPVPAPSPAPDSARGGEATSVTTPPSSVPTVVPPAVPPQPERATAWVAVVAADREYFTTMMSRSGPDAQGLYFPAFSPEVQLPLTGNQITIGRRRHSTGEAPDIDLAKAPEDPGVSHKHAVLVQQPDGAWSVVDQDSTNGTTVNLAEDPIRPYTPVPLEEGDRVHVGAWTTITLRRA